LNRCLDRNQIEKMPTDFYEKTYYDSHYAQFLSDAAYFELKGLFWKKAIQSLWKVPDNCQMLDFGCGLGQVTAAFPKCAYYDLSEFSRQFVRKRGNVVYNEPGEIPEAHFDVILSSHSLEHTPDPCELLQRFTRWTSAKGELILILPIERDFSPRLEVDKDNHLFAWTFQTISNLLHATGWQPCLADWIYDSWGLRQLSKRMGKESAVDLAWRLGKYIRTYRSMLLAARKRPSRDDV